jgi:CRP-like cAMP-binding protein
MSQPGPAPKQISGLEELIIAHLHSLATILIRPHSLAEIEPDITALNEIVHLFKGASELVEKLGDTTATEEQRRRLRRDLGRQMRLINSHKKEMALQINKSQELIKKAVALSTKEEFSIAAPAVQNRIIARLPETEREALIANMERVSLNLAQVLYQEDEDFQYVYFPETAIVSLFSILENGSTVGVGMIGNEGIVGIRVLSEALTIPYHAVVQKAGTALRIKAPFLREGARITNRLQVFLLDYTQGVLTQISQLAACNQFHSVEQKLVRWLLMMHDRSESDTLLLTHDLISNMIGARRAGVSIAAAALQEAGLIQYRRGLITVLDRKAMEEAACECYRVIKQVFDRLTT